MKSAFNSKYFIEIGSEMSSGDLNKKKDEYTCRVKFSCAPTLLATYCTIASFEVCPRVSFYHGYGNSGYSPK